MASALATSTLKLPSVRDKHKMSTDSVLLAGVFSLLFFGPLAFGAVEPWAIFVLEAGAAILLAVWLRKQSTTGELSLRNNPLYFPMAGLAAVVLLQIVFGWTAYRHDTISKVLLYVAYALFAFLANQSLRRNSQARMLALAISAYGVAVAGFALMQGLSPNGKLYWVRTPYFGGWIYGPYVNHNHYAGLMEMLVPVPLVLCLTRHADSRIRKMAAAGAALMAGTIFFSGSRGGMLALIVQLVLLAIVFVKMQSGTRAAASVGFFAVVVAFLLVWIGGLELTNRVASIGTETKQEITGGTRWTIDKDSFRMFLRKPILGWGFGTFSTAYPQFRTFYTNLSVTDAHNDYLQHLVETGAVGFAAMLWFLVTMYRNAWKKLRDWPSEITGAVALACMLGCTGILVHSFVDFNLQIPANAAWFYVLCVLGASPHVLESHRRVRRSRQQPAPEPDAESPNANLSA
jgi:O-antigen ligase